MASQIVNEIKTKSDAAFARLRRQIDGLEAHADRADAPGQWTAREVVAHLVSEPGLDPVAGLKAFAEHNFPTIDVDLGKNRLTPDRKTMSLKQLADALDRQRQQVLAYVSGLSDEDLTRRKARVHVLKALAGTDEVPLQMFAAAILDFHVNDHVGQLAKIRKAVGLPEVN